MLREALDAIDGTVVVYDADNRYVMGNKAYHDFFPHLPPDTDLGGKTYAEVLSLSVAARATVVPFSDPDAFMERRVQEMSGEPPPPRETFDARRNRWYMIRVRRTETGIRVALRVDITEQKAMQADLERARAGADQANQAKSRFIANVSHELRTPLNAVINFARLLEDEIHGPLGAEPYREYAQRIHESGRHLQSLIEEVLELSHADPTLPESRGTPINLRGLIASVGRTIQQQNATRGVGLDVTLPPDLPSVLGDQARLRRVLTTLIARAIHVSEPGATVHVRASLGDAGGPEIVVEDSAPAGPESGFSDTDSWRSARSDVLSGVALGLPMMRHIVDLFGGTLLIEAAPTGGTIATIRLPAERVIR